MLNQLMNVVKLYIITYARVIISSHKPELKPGDILLNTNLKTICCLIPPYPKTRRPVWCFRSDGYFIYMDYWKDLYMIYNKYRDDLFNTCDFYHEPYLNEILANLKFVLVEDGNFSVCVWVTHFHICDMDFYLYIDDNFGISEYKDITEQIQNRNKLPSEIRTYITTQKFLRLNYESTKDWMDNYYIKGLSSLPKKYIMIDATFVDGGSRTAVLKISD